MLPSITAMAYIPGIGMLGKPPLILPTILSALVVAISLSLSHLSPVSAAIMINEFSSNSSPEWVELYNPDLLPVSLTGWTIKDGAQPPRPLDSLVSIAPHGFIVYETSAGWLNNSGGDAISLFAPNPESTDSPRLIDQVAYGGGSSIHTPQSDRSSARLPDGGPLWGNNLVWTRGSPNPTPLPTTPPTPTPSLFPTTPPTTHPTKPPALVSLTPTRIPTSTTAPSVTFTRTTPSSPPSATTPGISVSPVRLLANRTPPRPTLPLLFISSGLLLLGAATLILSRDLVREHRSRHDHTPHENEEDY